jgi:hypothetical protein
MKFCSLSCYAVLLKRGWYGMRYIPCTDIPSSHGASDKIAKFIHRKLIVFMFYWKKLNNCVIAQHDKIH